MLELQEHTTMLGFCMCFLISEFLGGKKNTNFASSAAADCIYYHSLSARPEEKNPQEGQRHTPAISCFQLSCPASTHKQETNNNSGPPLDSVEVHHYHVLSSLDHFPTLLQPSLPALLLLETYT